MDLISFIIGSLTTLIFLIFIGFVDIMYFNQLPKYDKKEMFKVYVIQSAWELGAFIIGLLVGMTIWK